MTEEVQEVRGTKNRNVTILLVIIVLLLAAVLAANIYTIVTVNEQHKQEEEQAAAYAEQVLEYKARAVITQILIDDQLELIEELMTGYEESAYGPSVDRIAEQQLIATEHQLIALQFIGLQNSQLLSLMASLPFPPGSLQEPEPEEQ